MMSLSRGRLFVGAAVAAGAMAFAVVGAPSAHATGISAVTDPVFATCLQGYLTAQGATDLESLTGAVGCAGGNGSGTSAPTITSIEGAQYLTGITSLDLSFNLISDVTPLAGLNNLTYVALGWNQISDISMLGSLTAMDGATGHAFVATHQMVSLPATSVGTYSLSSLGVASTPARAIAVTVTSGPATVDNAAGTITFTGAGAVGFYWVPADSGFMEDFFSGGVTVTVTDASAPSSEPPSSEPPSSEPPLSEPPSVPASSSEPSSEPASSGSPSESASSVPPSVPASSSAGPSASGSGTSGVTVDTGGSLQSPSSVVTGLVIGLALIAAGLIVPMMMRRRSYTSHQA